MLSSFSHANVPRDITESAAQTSRTSMPRGKKGVLNICKWQSSATATPFLWGNNRQKILRYIALFVQKNIRVKSLDYGCVRALPREDIQPGDCFFSKVLHIRCSWKDTDTIDYLASHIMLFSNLLQKKYRKTPNSWYTHSCISSFSIEKNQELRALLGLMCGHRRVKGNAAETERKICKSNDTICESLCGHRRAEPSAAETQI